MKSPKIRAAAQGEECTFRSPWCNFDPETTVFCHLNESFAGKGLSLKADDYAGFFGCSNCHDIYDRRVQPSEEYRQDEYDYLLRAVVRTLGRLFEKGVLHD
jgi:hypothetical protein